MISIHRIFFDQKKEYGLMFNDNVHKQDKSQVKRSAHLFYFSILLRNSKFREMDVFVSSLVSNIFLRSGSLGASRRTSKRKISR